MLAEIISSRWWSLKHALNKWVLLMWRHISRVEMLFLPHPKRVPVLKQE